MVDMTDRIGTVRLGGKSPRGRNSMAKGRSGRNDYTLCVGEGRKEDSETEAKGQLRMERFRDYLVPSPLECDRRTQWGHGCGPCCGGS